MCTNSSNASVHACPQLLTVFTPPTPTGQVAAGAARRRLQLVVALVWGTGARHQGICKRHQRLLGAVACVGLVVLHLWVGVWQGLPAYDGECVVGSKTSVIKSSVEGTGVKLRGLVGRCKRQTHWCDQLHGPAPVGGQRKGQKSRSFSGAAMWVMASS